MAKIVFTLLVLSFIAGCASEKVKPFASLGVGHLLNSSSDYWLSRERSWQCDEWQQAWIEVGAEFKGGCSLSVVHQSWWFCGGPFNEKPEVDFNALIGKCKIGGFK